MDCLYQIAKKLITVFMGNIKFVTYFTVYSSKLVGKIFMNILLFLNKFMILIYLLLGLEKTIGKHKVDADTQIRQL